MKLHFLQRQPGDSPGGLVLPERKLRKPKLSKLRRFAGGPADRLALTEVTGNLTHTATTVTAWFTLAEQIWPFKADAKRETLLVAIAGQYAGIAGHHLHLRRTTVPFAIEQWAQTMAANSNPLPDSPSTLLPAHSAGRTPTWEQHLGNATARLAQGEYAQGRTQLGVVFPRPSSLTRMVKNAGGLDEALAIKLDHLTESLAAFGMEARPSTSAELSWLIFRSVGIGLTPPNSIAGDVGPDDIMEFADNVHWRRGPYSSTTELTDRSTGETSYVAVLSIGRMEPQEVPQVHQPWAHLSEQTAWPVEWSSRVDILAPSGTRRALETRLGMLLSQRRDYDDHNQPEPRHLARLADRAAEIGDELDTALPAIASRAHGWHRMAIAGPTEKEALQRVRDMIRMYGEQAKITVVSPKGQYPLLREFIPGEPLADTGYLRRMPVMTLAGAMPQAIATVGDNRGDWIGHTATAGQRPVFFDPHYPMMVRERSGLAVLVSEPGGGKSTLMGALAYLNVRRGVQVTLMDPSGPLAALCKMPELRHHSRVVDLVGSERGTLAPYALIPTPQLGDFDTEAEYETAVAMAQAERSALALDIMQMVLPPQLLEKSEIVVALHEALRLVAPEETTTLDDVVAALHGLGVAGDLAAKTAAGLLSDVARLPLAKLFFGSPPPGTLDADAALTVITMGGLQLPDLSIDRNHWSVGERLAVPMLHLAHRLAVRRSYGGDPNKRKFVGLDEAHFMQGWASGRSFLIRLARDSRKKNIAALVASQNPADILGLDVQNLVTTVFVGRIVEDEEIAREALRLLRVKVGSGYEAVLAGLSQHADTASDDRLGFREFVMRDVDGRVQKVRVDVSYVQGLLEALNTTPGGSK
jgi:hypothetical protein